MTQILLFWLIIIGFLISSCTFLFYFVHSYFPSEVAEVKDLEILESKVGKAIIVKILITYDVKDTKKQTSMTLSGKVGHRDSILARVQMLREYYDRRIVRYYHLPLITKIGHLAAPWTYPQQWVALALAAIFLVILAVMFYSWV